MSMLGYSSKSMFEYKMPTSRIVNQVKDQRISPIGRDIRELTQQNTEFIQTQTDIKRLLIKLGDESMIDSNRKIHSMFEGRKLIVVTTRRDHLEQGIRKPVESRFGGLEEVGGDGRVVPIAQICNRSQVDAVDGILRASVPVGKKGCECQKSWNVRNADDV